MFNYPSIDTAPKDGTPIWAAGACMVYGRPYRWDDKQERWLCWFGIEQGFVSVSQTPKHWCPSLTKIAVEVVSGDKPMPFQQDIRRPRALFNLETS